MKIQTILLISFFTMSISYGQTSDSDIFKTNNHKITVHPKLHSSMILEFSDKTIAVDPYGGAEKFKGVTPDIVLITDTHGDHLHLATLETMNIENSIFIVPDEVAKKLPEKYNSKIIILKNGQGVHRLGFFIMAIPMYNLPETTDSRHPKGRGNGYLIEFDQKRIYISGDTSGIKEMKMLKNIDIAFVCMNLPYTMDIQEAAKAVLEFQPKVVFPYHYRGKNGLSDTEEFKKLVTKKNSTIDVRLRDWYSGN